MRKLKQILTLLLAGSMLLTGCGRIESSKEDSTINVTEDAASESLAEKAERENALNAATPIPTAGTFTAERGYSDADREVSILGLKEYKKLKSDKYTDKANNGKKFLVLFLKVRNRTAEKVYFNVNYLSAKVDDKEIENTVLLNEPEGYPTIFSNIAPDSYYGGFIVWEVPENWKKLEVTYEGWRDSDGLTLSSTLTKKDLAAPEEYSAMTYNQSED